MTVDDPILRLDVLIRQELCRIERALQCGDQEAVRRAALAACVLEQAACALTPTSAEGARAQMLIAADLAQCRVSLSDNGSVLSDD